MSSNKTTFHELNKNETFTWRDIVTIVSKNENYFGVRRHLLDYVDFKTFHEIYSQYSRML
ncbi:hypothetical protein BFO01nite_48450 [Brevibacillus formosus]|uniref:Uncharacterized protein n=1 Tax=Brevibacillus formosus TaxID=54913 RepID=A0ABQ0TG72_9BACL|nr:hypothetical protein BFO01nite_48450 [Brevibacillus formosus]